MIKIRWDDRKNNVNWIKLGGSQRNLFFFEFNPIILFFD